MQTVSAPSASSPELVFDLLTSFQKTAALNGALELNLFTVIGQGNHSVSEIAAHCKASERGIRILCDYMTVLGLLHKVEGRYELTPTAAVFLDARSPACVAEARRFLSGPMTRAAFEGVAAAVRKGGTVLGKDSATAPENPAWVDFARAMGPITGPAAAEIADLLGDGNGQPWKVLDIAAGHGLFGIHVAMKNPAASVVAVDWPQVLAVAQENASKFGVAERYSTRAGSAFEVDFGSGYDVALLTNFCHHFNREMNLSLARKIFAALKPGGRLVTLEFAPNDDRISPPGPAAFSLVMLVSTESGDAYTAREYMELFEEAGFAKTQLHPLQRSMQQLLVSEKGNPTS
jgi:Methylase involved in ubiquinone/menaquinone biosynthesis